MGRGELPLYNLMYFEKGCISQSPSFWNSGKRYFGTFSPSLGKRFCIRPFLWSFRASSFSLWAVIRLSRDERQEAIFCCSWGEGWAIDNLENTDIQWRL